MKITLEFPGVIRFFDGEWLVGDQGQGLRPDDDGRMWDAKAEWSVARRSKNGALVVVYRPGSDEPQMEQYDSFADFRDDSTEAGPSHPENLIAAVAEILNEPYEIDMDI